MAESQNNAVRPHSSRKHVLSGKGPQWVSGDDPVVRNLLNLRAPAGPDGPEHDDSFDDRIDKALAKVVFATIGLDPIPEGWDYHDEFCMLLELGLRSPSGTGQILCSSEDVMTTVTAVAERVMQRCRDDASKPKEVGLSSDPSEDDADSDLLVQRWYDLEDAVSQVALQLATDADTDRKLERNLRHLVRTRYQSLYECEEYVPCLVQRLAADLYRAGLEAGRREASLPSNSTPHLSETTADAVSDRECSGVS